MTDDLALRLAGPSPAGGEPPPDVTARVAAAADAEGLVDVAWTMTDSPVGPLLVAATRAGLVRIAYDAGDAVLTDLATHLSPRVLELPSRLDAVRRQLDEYFAGRLRKFDLAIDRALSSGFRRQVLEQLIAVGYGRTVTYADLARAVGNPGATRAVGTAMRTNPIPIVQPCHRVLPSGGGLGNYNGGVDRKAALLGLEGVLL